MRRLLLLLLAALPALGQEPAPEKPPLRVLRTGGLRVETAALLMSGQEGGTIPMAALAIPLPGGEDGKARVAILLEVDGAEAVEGQKDDLLRLEVCLYAVTSAPDGSGRVSGSRMDTVEIDLARLGADLERSGLKYAGELRLAPGDYALRALVRNAGTGEVGLRVLPLSVPDFGQDREVLLPPLVAEPEGAWLQARGAGIASLPPGLSPEALPSARPIFSPSEEVPLRIPVWLPGGGELQAEVRRPGGARVAAFPLRVASRSAGSTAGAAGLEIVTASVRLQGIEEGVYELGIVRAARGSDEPALATPFVLLERGGGGKVWAALTPSQRSRTAASEAAPARAAGAAAPRVRRTRKIDAGPVRDGYRAALRRLASGDRDGARDAVIELQTKVLTGERPATSNDLLEVELEVVDGLSRDDAESLVPVVILHQVLYREAVRKAAFLLSTHNRELVFRLVDLYAHRSSPERRRHASRFLMGLAAEMIWTAPPSLRARVFQQILAYDSREETAILCLAVDAERQGRYADAVGHLERLGPGHAEARLRLAINLARLGKVQAAGKLLRELSDPAAPPADIEPWQLAVAWQETARLQLAAGDLDGAEQTLREGRRRLPEDDKLALLLGLVRDLRKDPRGAREAVAGLEKTPGAGGEARHRYNQLPVESLDQAWTDIQALAAEQIPALARVLGVTAPDATPRSTP